MTNRKLKEAGINPILAYFLGLTVFVLLSEYIFQKTEFATYLVILSSLSLQFKLSVKNRSDFLLSTFGDKTKNKIRVLENLFLSIPFVFILLYKHFFLEASTLVVCSIVIALFAPQTNMNFTIPTPFSKRPFEFSVGFRKLFFIFPIAYALTVTAIHVDNLNLGIFSMLLIFLTSMSFYSNPEQEYYVWVHAETPRVFLINKLLKASKNATLLVAPSLICLTLFYPSEIDFILLFILIGLLFLWTTILAKYSAYPEKMNLPEGIILAFGLYFPPLLLAVIPYLYTKSINNLKLILND